MSHTDFEEIFQSFRTKFPPANDPTQAVMKLSTAEMVETLFDFWPEMELPRGGITRFMIDQGYKYNPEA